MSDWYLDQALERSRERQHQAEQAWLIHEALADAPRPSGWREQVLVGLGDLFVAVGHRLQLSGGCSAAPPIMDATDGR